MNDNTGFYYEINTINSSKWLTGLYICTPLKFPLIKRSDVHSYFYSNLDYKTFRFAEKYGYT